MSRLVSLLVLAALLLPAPAHAVPEGGAGANTPGASASVSPRSVAAGATIHFTISGFPAGEIVYLKIDDGNFCSKKGVHGACVVHQQRLSKSGSASGSFTLPDDLKPGAHWLRFLASQEMTDGNGNYLGIKGFTTRKGADFTLTKAGASGTGPSNAPTSTPSAAASASAAVPPSAGATSSAPPESPTDDLPVVPAGGVLTVVADGAPAAEATTPPAPATPGVAPATRMAPAAAVQTPPGRFPLTGTIALAVLLAVAGGLLLLARRTRG